MSPGQPTSEDVLHELDRVLSSALFARSERQSRFLRFLVLSHLEGRAHELKESVIAFEVFGRKPTYDPKLDAIVRTEAVRLRARLDKYYAGEGSQDTLIIELPKGGYRPVFRERPMVPAAPATRLHRLWRIGLPIGLAFAALIAAAATWWARSSPSDLAIAVVPLEGHGGDQASDSFADGLTDELIRNLALVEGLSVPSRASSFALKGKRLAAADAGAQLRADYLLGGSVLRSDDSLRINAELIRIRDDYRLWSGRFDLTGTDVVAMQDEISRTIVNSVRVNLNRSRRRYETNRDAYDLYLRGRQTMEGFPAQGRNIAMNAVRYYNQAIERDPNYAIAYAGKADALLAIDLNVWNPEAYRRARVAAERAVELDPLLSEAHSALASIRARDYAWDEAERAFRRALELNPDNTLARLQLGLSVLIVQGRLEEGLAEVRRAAALDPVSPRVATEYGHALLYAGKYDDAVGQLRKAIELDSSRNRPYGFLRRALLLQGRLAEAATVLDEAVTRGAQLNGVPTVERPCLAAAAGRRDEALLLLQQVLTTSRAPRAIRPTTPNLPDPTDEDRGVTASWVSTTPLRSIARIYACLGDEARALEYLEKALAQREPGLPEILADPEFPWMRAGSRFASLRKRLNLPS